MDATVNVMPEPKAAPDIAGIDEVLAVIAAHPESWDQSAWRCETGMCFAGWRARLDGAPWATDERGHGVALRYTNGTYVGPVFLPELIIAPGESWAQEFARHRVVKDVVHVKEWARRSLGLSAAQAAAMFDASNDLEWLRKYRDRLADDPTDQLDHDDADLGGM